MSSTAAFADPVFPFGRFKELLADDRNLPANIGPWPERCNVPVTRRGKVSLLCCGEVLPVAYEESCRTAAVDVSAERTATFVGVVRQEW